MHEATQLARRAHQPMLTREGKGKGGEAQGKGGDGREHAKPDASRVRECRGRRTVARAQPLTSLSSVMLNRYMMK